MILHNLVGQIIIHVWNANCLFKGKENALLENTEATTFYAMQIF